MLAWISNRFWDWFYRPRLDWVQVEVNTDCNARCLYCPTAVLGKDWPRRQMSLETFCAILPNLVRSAQISPWRAPLIHLQGWGEPFLNPGFFDMAEAAGAAGSRVGTTSNGTRIDEHVAERLVASGIDMISFSVAGVDERGDSLRIGTRLADVFSAIEKVNRARDKAAKPGPSIHIAYMLLRSGLDEVERIPETFAGLGIEEIVVSILNLVPDPALMDQSIRPRTEAEYLALNARLDRVAAAAQEKGMGLSFRFPRPNRPPGLCTENVQAALVVDVDGRVLPCVLDRFLGDGDAHPNPDAHVFGDLTRESLADIWWKKTYVGFRRSFWDAAPPPRCQRCSRLGQS
ncbi:MAG: radical SAM protein [Rhodospirillales bacterium]|nr:radical SAM protein [Rhodospirillales bacterium]